MLGAELDVPLCDGPLPLGARGRAVLVVGDEPELAVALRERLDRVLVTVRELGHAEAAAAVDACRPRPWMVAGSGDRGSDPALVAALAGSTTLVHWLGLAPSGLPRHTRRFDRFSDLAAAISAALAATVAGIRLAPGDGLTMPDGRHAAGAALEALVACHPRPLFVARRLLAGVDRVLEAHGVRLRVVEVEPGGFRLEEVDR